MENTFHIQWHITDRCNLRCLHCYQDSFSSKSELSLTSLKKIFSNVVEFVDRRKQKLVIDITGGEPLLYNNWKELFLTISNHPSVEKTGIITNGFFLDEETIKFLTDFKSAVIKVSAEGVKQETFELFRGKGTYERFIKICELLKDNFQKGEKILMFTLTKDNTGEVADLFDFIREYNFSAFILERFIPWGLGRKISESLISHKEWLSTLKILCDRCGVEEDINALLPYRGFMVKAGKTFELFGAPCIVGTDGIAIMPDGSVFPCRRFPLKIGNLLETPLKDIWKESDVLIKLRNNCFLKGRCKGCKIKDCRGCRALAYSVTGDFLEEDPLCLL